MIVEIDWLSLIDVVKVCRTKILKIPLNRVGMLEIQDEKSESSKQSLTSATNKVVKLIDIPVIREILDVFPDEVPVLPPPR